MRTIIKKAYKTQRMTPQSGEKSVHSNSLTDKVWQYCPHSGTKMLILLYLARTHNENDDSSYPSQTRIAQYCRVSRQQVNKLLGELYESGDVDIITYGGTATANGSTNRYRLTKYINLTFDSSTSPSVLEKDLRQKAGRRVSQSLSENTVNSSGQPLVNSSGQRTKDIEPKTIKNNVPETRGVVGDTKGIVPNKPSLRSSDLTSIQVNDLEDVRGENWLIGISKQLWGKELSDAQIAELKKPVRCAFGLHIGTYPSPLEYAMDERYNELFRKWVLEKKNPRTDKAIFASGMKKWISQHIRNYTSPEGFLMWLKNAQGIDLSPKPITVMENSRIYDLVEMEMFVHNRVSPKNEVAISMEFKKFYAENIGKVKTNEEFKTLWGNK